MTEAEGPEKGRVPMWRTALTLASYSFVCGTLVGFYAFLNFPLNIICSLGALLLGIRFFKRNPTKGMRIGLILLSILFYFVFVFMMSVYLYMQQMPAPAA
ncbi:hypothetical protein M5W83_04800 [Paenibacillus thiaminolyticus]|uniref:DUF4190 domain-containing protein n=2 Tax=Paenibacillus thiaminolyticus TaxID=49283 RepID=A0ABT4FQP5_PANTH|nr:hypothetical protein [Paenibacillus thiaminolyticus]MCY9534482.1 hypothetical protein [Paenibacillus thiaminolyticus]MCY9601292.1 hypothetical protein [Paenibacillus thiaminolyticus]MCY9606479.1 hypothetical protein [Paenibacillus thiaminolyticus]MCY9614079.1 hypothetical protein [Paenibacillus thiaminolyticus]MCY9618616.1 hypothetical protein [Paenibacillus thiaminolyticus]